MVTCTSRWRKSAKLRSPRPTPTPSGVGCRPFRGEVTEGDVAGYHYYPGRAQVMAWLAAEGLTVVDEDVDQQDGWAYRHLIVRA